MPAKSPAGSRRGRERRAPPLARHARRTGCVRRGSVDRPSTFHLEHRQERFLRHLDGSDLLHTTLAYLLFLEQLEFALNVTAVTFGGDVLADRPQRLARHDPPTDCG